MRRRIFLTTVAILVTASRVALADDDVEPPAPTPAATTPAAPTPAAPTTPAPEHPSVYLHVTSSKTVTIQRQDTSEIVCTSPCDKNVPADAQYRVVSDRPSPSFVLAPAEAGGRADVRVKPGSRTAFWTGVAGLGLGGALIAGGVATLVYAYDNRAEVPGADGVDTDNSYTDAMIVGTTLIIGGTFAGLWGGATVIANAKTTVRGNVQTADAPARRTNVAGGLPRATFISILAGAF